MSLCTVGRRRHWRPGLAAELTTFWLVKLSIPYGCTFRESRSRSTGKNQVGSSLRIAIQNCCRQPLSRHVRVNRLGRQSSLVIYSESFERCQELKGAQIQPGGIDMAGRDNAMPINRKY